jgi:hypothetical protein
MLVRLDRDFPRDDRGDQGFVFRIFDDESGVCAQHTGGIESPQNGVRVEENLHEATSSGLPSSIMMSKPYSRSSSSVSKGFHQSLEY